MAVFMPTLVAGARISQQEGSGVQQCLARVGAVTEHSSSHERHRPLLEHSAHDFDRRRNLYRGISVGGMGRHSRHWRATYSLVPGFVVATELVPGGRRVTFANGMIVVEPIVSLNEELHRLVWTAHGGSSALIHYNSAVQVYPRETGGSRVVWMTDVLPDDAASRIGAMMRQGATAMSSAFMRLAKEGAKQT